MHQKNGESINLSFKRNKKKQFYSRKIHFNQLLSENPIKCCTKKNASFIKSVDI